MKFDAQFFAGNRRKLRRVCPDLKLFMVASNGVMQRSADTAFPFRQESNFWYLTGVNEPDMWLYMDESGDYLVLANRDSHRDLWEGAINHKQLIRTSGVDGVITLGELEKMLKKQKSSAIGSLPAPDPYIVQIGLYTNPHRAYLQTFLDNYKLKIEDVRLDIARLRQIKQAAELAAIKSAVDITVKTLGRIKPFIEDFKTEDELEREISAKFLQKGSKFHAYNPIVASGKNATTIHYEKNDSLVRKNELLLLDVGAEYQNYASDITRTWAAGKPTKRQQQIHGLVFEIQDFAFGLLKPGVLMQDFEKKVADFAATIAVKNKLISKKSEIRSIYPHATSHFMGLDVHDAADYDLPLAAGMVLTVEPGIYLPGEGIGVRIEDDVLITEKGINNLSSALSPEL